LTNFITYSDVEYAKFGTSGKTFTVAQRTAVTNLITKAHGLILMYLGTTSDPTSTEGLKAVELQITLNLLWNAENPAERPQPALTKDLRETLDNLYRGDDADSEPEFDTVLLRDYEDYYGY